jgi:hypothetical protein
VIDPSLTSTLIGVCTVAGGWAGAYLGGRKAIEVTVAVLSEKVSKLELDAELLEGAKQRHESVLTQHHVRLHALDRLSDDDMPSLGFPRR